MAKALAVAGSLADMEWGTCWLDPVDVPAALAALAMRDALAAHNRELRARGQPALAMGIGIHRGPVVAGVLGTSGVREYGVLGHTVNLASRVEDLTRVHAADILVTDAVRARCDPRFRLRALPAVEVKGLPEPLVTFAVDGVDAG